ncbi:MAG: hypothetical protein WDN31_00375 [Hyphomicrobium sp.]
MTKAQTIFALSSAAGRAGIAVVRISGARAGEVLDRMAPPRPENRYAALRRICDPESGEPHRRGAGCCGLPPRRTETGEDMAELHLHGGPAIVKAVLGAPRPAARLSPRRARRIRAPRLRERQDRSRAG